MDRLQSKRNKVECTFLENILYYRNIQRKKQQGGGTENLQKKWNPEGNHFGKSGVSEGKVVLKKSGTKPLMWPKIVWHNLAQTAQKGYFSPPS
ncbi:MAG: hypothetical protein Q4A17_03320 [Thermoguttaceae bacterium]|nr:hypothetical protein [Thermoguttaceae bacterium]